MKVGLESTLKNGLINQLWVRGDDCLIAAHHGRYYTWTILNTHPILILNGLDVHDCCLYCGIIMFDVGIYKESMLCPNANPKECASNKSLCYYCKCRLPYLVF
jgi:hypothetical protein